MHQLVTGAEDVEATRAPALRDPGGVDGAGGELQQSQEDEVAQRHALVLRRVSVQEHAVELGRESEESEQGKEVELDVASPRRSELGVRDRPGAAEGGGGGRGPVHVSEAVLVVEAEVVAGYHRAPHDDYDAEMIESMEEGACFFAVVAEEVESLRTRFSCRGRGKHPSFSFLTLGGETYMKEKVKQIVTQVK